MARRVAVAMVLPVLIVLLAAPPGLAQQPKRGGILRIAEREAASLDPHLSVSFLTHSYVSLVYSQLVRFPNGPEQKHPADFSIVPDLAEKWEYKTPVSLRQACAGQGQGDPGASVRPGSVRGLSLLGRRKRDGCPPSDKRRRDRRSLARWTRSRTKRRQRGLVVPRHPRTRVARDVFMVPLQGDQILERRDAVEFGGVDEAHEHIADACAVQRLVEEGVLAMQDHLLQRALADVVVQRRLASAPGAAGV
jgi:hypothetical protein